MRVEPPSVGIAVNGYGSDFQDRIATFTEGTGAAGAATQAWNILIELTGNETIVTVDMGKAQTVVKMDKNYDVPVDTPVGIAVDRAKVCLFDPATGDRIRAA